MMRYRAAAAFLGMMSMAQPISAQEAVIRICVIDASTGAALPGSEVTSGTSVPTVMRGSCANVPAGRVRLRRVGFRPVDVVVRESSTIGLFRLSLPQLDTVKVAAARSGIEAQTATTIAVDEARARAAGSLSQLMALSPFLPLPGARGDLNLSLRGSRREQVAVTLDGMQLGNPATGVADVSDLPLVALRSVTVALGASPVQGGPGALGGVVALESTASPAFSVGAASFGARRVEGLESWSWRRASMSLGAAYSRAHNNFPFTNTGGATGSAAREVRVNNDESIMSIMSSLLSASAQLSLIATRTDRGMVGPMNVRTYDHDRARTQRITARMLSAIGSTEIDASARAFTLDYRDPARPVFDNSAVARAADVSAARSAFGARVEAGAGGDHVRATGNVRQQRLRAHASVSGARVLAGSLDTYGGIRVDAVGGTVIPSFSLRSIRTLAFRDSAYIARIGLRIAQAMRAPTLYDLYFASPQRVVVNALRPERVPFDGEVSVHLSHVQREDFKVSVDASAIARRVNDAIVWFPGNFSWSPANVGREDTRGFDGRVQLGSRGFTLDAWGHLYDSWLQSGALRIPVPYQARVGGGLQPAFRLGGTTLSLNMRFFGARPFSVGPRDPAYELPPVQLVDAALSHRFSISRISALAALGVENAGNEVWQSVRGFPSPGRRYSVSLTLDLRGNP